MGAEMEMVETKTERARVAGNVFVTVLIVSFVDQLGRDFLGPLVIPYSLALKDDELSATLSTLVFSLFLIFASIWMSMLADRMGERFVICISLAGSMTAYGCQALGWEFKSNDAGFWIFVTGRALEGFFGGTQAVLTSLVSRWFMDPGEFKQRVALLGAFGSMIGMFLAPVAGSIAKNFGLNAPFRFASIMCALGLIFALLTLPKESPVKMHSEDDESPELTAEQENEPAKSIWTDAIMLIAFLSNLILGVVIQAMTLLETLLIDRNKEFGVSECCPGDKEKQRTELGEILSLIVVPLGLTSTFVAVAIYPKLSESWGDALLVFVFGGIFCGALVLEGFAVELWQVFFCSGLQGVGLGVLMPVLGPMMAIYGGSVYPKQVAEVIAMPMIGLAIGMMFGQPLFVKIDTYFESDTVDGERAAFVVLGAVCLISTCGLSLAATWIDSVVQEKIFRQSEQEKAVFLEDKGEAPSEFIASAIEQVSAYLKDHAKSFQNQPMQDLMLHNLLNSVPKLPSWSDDTNGKEYLEALHTEMQHAGLEKQQEAIQSRFPSSAVAGGVHVGVGGAMGFSSMPRRRKPQAAELEMQNVNTSEAAAPFV